MTTHIVCLSFDFDAMSGFVARGQMSPTPISRGEFGRIGAQRVLALLGRYELPATWFIPGVVIGTYPRTCEQILAAGHEIAHHGWTHAPPASLSREEEESGLRRGNEAIEGLSGRRARGYRSPSWDLSASTVELLIDHGFLYDSSMMGHDCSPYYARVGDRVQPDEPFRAGTQTGLVEMPISWSLDDHPHFEFARSESTVQPGLKNAGQVLENWIEDFDFMAAEVDWGILTYTFHPYVIGRGHRMRALERLIEALQRRGARFMRMEDAAARFAARCPRASPPAGAGPD